MWLKVLAISIIFHPWYQFYWNLSLRHSMSQSEYRNVCLWGNPCLRWAIISLRGLKSRVELWRVKTSPNIKRRFIFHFRWVTYNNAIVRSSERLIVSMVSIFVWCVASLMSDPNHTLHYERPIREWREVNSNFLYLLGSQFLAICFLFSSVTRSCLKWSEHKIPKLF